MGMLGGEGNPNFGAKAAETHGLLDFCVQLLRDHMAQLRAIESCSETAQALLGAGEAAQDFERILKTSKRKLDDATLEAMFTAYYRFASLYVRADGNIVGKLHLMFHLIIDARYKGNPRFYSTYKDESFNGVLAKIARATHRLDWYQGIFKKVSVFNTFHLSQNMHVM